MTLKDRTNCVTCSQDAMENPNKEETPNDDAGDDDAQGKNVL